jgi:hypothetical protein
MHLREMNNVRRFQSVKVVLSPGAKPSPPPLCAKSCLAVATRRCQVGTLRFKRGRMWTHGGDLHPHDLAWLATVGNRPTLRALQRLCLGEAGLPRGRHGSALRPVWPTLAGAAAPLARNWGKRSRPLRQAARSRSARRASTTLRTFIRSAPCRSRWPITRVGLACAVRRSAACTTSAVFNGGELAAKAHAISTLSQAEEIGGLGMDRA